MVKLSRHIISTTMIVAVAAYASAGVTLNDTHTRIEYPQFHTLQTRLNGNEQQPPVILLNSDDRLQITFDELSDEHRYMRYELIHCDARWRPDRLVSPEYLDGFNEGTIDDYAFSQATMTHYINYSLTIPNEQMRPTLSGNYLLRVFDEASPDETILQVRFSIVEPVVKPIAEVSSRTDIGYNTTYQQITVGFDTEGLDVTNPYQDFIITVEQDGRIDNSVTLETPNRVTGTQIWYEHNRDLIFHGGNEYRRMEIVSTTYPGMGVESLGFADPYYHATLKIDRPRIDDPYIYDSTQFGRFKVREYDSDASDTEADYIITHFALDMPEQTTYDIFIDGDMVQRRFTPESRMVYNRADGLYENAMLLKQGAYNYRYLAVPHGSMKGVTAAIEGDHYQTVNQYLIKIYYRHPGSRYDRLVGVTMVTSGE